MQKLQESPMNVSSSLRLKPLAACLAAALAIIPAATLLAEPLKPVGQSPAVRRSFAAQAIAASAHDRGPTLKDVMQQAVARARASHPPAARPAGVTPVTSCDDDGPGTLRDAFTNAVSGDAIDLSALSCGTITLTTGAMTTTADDLTVDGPGASALTIDAGSASGVMNHYGAGTLTIEGLTITNGRIEGQDFHGGACVLSAANVTVNDSTLSNCYAYMGHAYGGAISAAGNITLTNSTLSGNTTKGHYYYYYYPGYPNPYLINGTSWGGGAYATGRFTITNSTITHNRAEMNNRGSVGGGIASRAGGHSIAGTTFDNNYAWLGGGFEILGHYSGETSGLTIVNSTISGNTAEQSAGGFNSYRLAYTVLHNSTVTDNLAPYCGGMYVYYGTTDLKSSIIGGNRSTHAYNYFGLPTAADFDIFYNNATVGGDHNIVMTSNMVMPADTITDDPLLLPLADNGGPTMTHAFDMTSRALDAGSNPDDLGFDQRGDGYPRVLGAGADIGAYEAPGALPDPIFSDGFD
jgi:hypothetical protein